MMTDVVIAGIGQTVVGEHWDLSLRELAFYALEAAVKDGGGLRPQALYAGNMLAPIISRQSHLGTLIADFAGLSGIESSAVEAAGASGGAALRLGYLAVASGLVDAALVVGVEKITDLVGAQAVSAQASSTDSDYEADMGLTPAAQAALLMQRYMHEFGTPREAFGAFSVIAHRNGAANPYAMFQRAILSDTYNRAPVLSPPLNRFDAAPEADGAAAVLLTRQALLPPTCTHPLVRISGSSLVTEKLALHSRKDPLSFTAARLSVERSCRKAGIMPKDIDFFELDDAYSIYAALSLEAAGYAERGQGCQLAQDHHLDLNGELPILTMGGHKARGNPFGAAGVYQAVEAVQQLRWDAGENQIPQARRAMIQNLGGPGSTAVTHILERVPG